MFGADISNSITGRAKLPLKSSKTIKLTQIDSLKYISIYIIYLHVCNF